MGVDSNKMDAFEQKLRETLEHYEVPYNSSDWAQMERALSSGVRGWGHGRTVIVGFLLASAFLIGGTAYFIGRDAGTQEMAATTVVEQDSQISEATASLPVEEPLANEEPSTGTMPEMGEGHGLTTVSTTVTAPAAPVAIPNSSKSATASPAPVDPEGRNTGSSASAGTAFKLSVKEACPGSPVEFVVENMPEDGIYLWNFGDGSFSNKPNPQHVYTKPGNYPVMLSMSASGVGAIHNKPTSDVIVIHEAPHAAFNIVKMEYAGQVPSVHFESRALGGTSYFWDFGDGTVSTAENPDHVYRKKGVYQVVQTVTNAIGCVDRKVQELRIERDFDLGAPKSFSPNSDGKEDSFMPMMLTKLTSKFVLAIYDGSGSVVYTTSDPTRPWYGKAKNQGPVLPEGDYVWVADVNTDRGVETFTGTVKLVR